MLYTHNQEFTLDKYPMYQTQIHIGSGDVILEVSQDGLPFTEVEVFTEPTVKRIAFTGAKYRFVIMGDAQISIVPARLSN